MRKIIASLFFLALYLPVFACTTFLINKDGQLIFGRNYDWVTDAGMVCTNQRGLFKTSMPTNDGNTISWVSQYGSITFNQYGKEFPTGGMNEKGLVVELMWLDETRYPVPDQRPAIGVLQWIQYQLDNCSSIEEVIATDTKLRIASIGTTPLHYLVADAAGNAATIEFLSGKLVSHKGTELALPVLTNSIYEESAQSYKNIAATSGSGSFRYANNSLERFGQACSMIQQYKVGQVDKPVTVYAFDILAKVAQGSSTKWSIVYDITHKTIRFKTHRYSEVKIIDLSSFDLRCTAVAKAWDMNQATAGNINKEMKDFTQQMNTNLVETACRESQNEVKISSNTRTDLWQYALGIKCQ